MRLRVDVEIAHHFLFSQPVSVPFDGLLGQDTLSQLRCIDERTIGEMEHAADEAAGAATIDSDFTSHVFEEIQIEETEFSPQELPWFRYAEHKRER